MPSNIIANRLIATSGYPVAAPSANISGKPSGTKLEDIKEELDGKVDAFIDGGLVDIGVESTVVKVENEIPIILRPGKITQEEIREKIGECQLSKNLFKQIEDGEKIESPGMKYRHYAPNTKCILIYNQNAEKQIEIVNKLIKKYKKVCILGFVEDRESIDNDLFIELGSRDNLEEISRNIFTALRKVDTYRAEAVLIEGVSKEGIGLAIMNRLIRTCEYNFYEN